MSLWISLAITLSLVIDPTPKERPVEKTLAERLGYKATDRLLIIHADDVGMCHSVNVATINAMEKGVVSSASIMVPCPWMPEIAAYCRKNPKADFGLHLTLTSEWNLYRWRPVTPIGEVPGLLDAEGFIHHTVEETVAKASAEEVAKEIRSQIKRARAFGIVPTHVDSHMGTLFVGKFIGAYARVSKEEGIIPMMLEPTPARVEMGKQLGFDAEQIKRELAPQGYPFLDRLYESVEGDSLEARREFIYNLFRNLPAGVSEIIVHLAGDDEEIRHITGSWRKRNWEYQIMIDPATRKLIDSLGIKLIGYRELAKIGFK
jgi:predicted glycoside hydrolase/deacetylase ChbG (UPF0249 family)